MNYDAVLEGGGVKIRGLIGALAGIEARGFGPPRNIAGTSAGAIVAAFRAAGYSPKEMNILSSDLDFRQFKQGARWGTKGYHLMFHKGIYKSDAFYRYMQKMLAKKDVYTFKDLKTSDEDPRWRYNLKVIVSDVTEGRMITLPDDAHLYGIDPDELEVAHAVRMSMSIPGFYRPATMGKSIIVDGGLLSNFPIWLFDADGTPEWPTFGILLQEPHADQPHKINGVISYMMAIFQTMLKAHDRKAISGEDYFHRLIRVPTGNVKTTDFNITKAQKDMLYQNGFTSALDFLDEWSWVKYRRWAKQMRGVHE